MNRYEKHNDPKKAGSNSPEKGPWTEIACKKTVEKGRENERDGRKFSSFTVHGNKDYNGKGNEKVCIFRKDEQPNTKVTMIKYKEDDGKWKATRSSTFTQNR